MVDFVIKSDDVSKGSVVGSVSLKRIARHAAHAAEREVILLVLERTDWNRTRTAKLLEISYRALLYKIKNFGLRPMRRPLDRQDRFGPLEGA